jgi:hypothetical protein
MGKHMDKRFLIYKCSADMKKKALICINASDHDEAHEALAWLEKHHPENEDYKLGEGEFFEVLEEVQIPPDEWQEAMACLNKGK